MQKDNVQRPHKGLNRDSSIADQPKGTYRFALNAVNETENGDSNFVSNAEGNEVYATLSPGFIPIGKEYMSSNNVIIFSVNGGVSEIGILDNRGTYTVHVNDTSSVNKLKFDVNKQIDATYRLRRGCERTVYWVDDLNKPRYYNFDSPDDFKTGVEFDANLFSLQKTYSKTPNFDSITVADSGGALEAGSYNVAIQYVDEGLNPTEWINISKPVLVYNDTSVTAFSDIGGSINSDTDYEDFPNTGKALEINISNLDKSFIYYRLAIVEANNGSGEISKVVFSELIPTSRDVSSSSSSYIYTGVNGVGIGTLEELAQFSDLIEAAGSIEQIENRLILGNTKGKETNLCKLQKYASKIKADCYTKEVVLNVLDDPSNPKNPSHKLDGLGYMPGEIYSFGIVYVFADGSVSPVNHIPGKSPGPVGAPLNPLTVYEVDVNSYPMDPDNQINSVYDSSNVSCGGIEYWGRDSEGLPLEGKNVRHHRFPLRNSIGVPLIRTERAVDGEQSVTFYVLSLKVSGDLLLPIYTGEVITTEAPEFAIRITYDVDGRIGEQLTKVIDPATYDDGTGTPFTYSETFETTFYSNNDFTNIVIELSDSAGGFQDVSTEWVTYFSSAYDPDTVTGSAVTRIDDYINTVEDRVVKTDLLGIKFTNIQIPDPDDIEGEEIIGYYIVRNKRNEFDKTILDTGVLTPSLTNNKYISHGLLVPELTGDSRISASVFGLIHPEFKFNNKEYSSYNKVIHQGNFIVEEQKHGKFCYNDVENGSSYDSGEDKDGNDDGQDADGRPDTYGYDGWSLDVLSRDNILGFTGGSDFTFLNTDIKEKYYLDALESRPTNDNANDVWNIAADNRVGIIELEDGVVGSGNSLPYVVLKKDNLNVYSNFRLLPYYKDTTNPILFDLETGDPSRAIVFGGDSYVSPMRYVNTMKWDDRVARRAKQTNGWNLVAGLLVIAIGVALLAFGGAGALVIGGGIALIGAGALVGNSYLKRENYIKAYGEEYAKGLRETALDNWVNTFFNYNAGTESYFPSAWTGQPEHGGNHAKDGPSDDSIQWIGECLTDLWFDTTVNTALRVGMVTPLSTHLNAPGLIESGQDKAISLREFYGIYWAVSAQSRYPISKFENHLALKLLYVNPDRNDNRQYYGLPLGEWYRINPDYVRDELQKAYFHLPLEYDCCSECQEDFPHRVRYSEQSFQEELVDNYRIQLANNYRDIEGETGEITNIFKMGNDLFIHTKEGMWRMPRSYQERITDQVVSFIGTGSFFEIPPQKILDDEAGSSAGLQHKWSAIKTAQGYFFVCENQRKIYQFSGKQLNPISSIGLDHWFKTNTELLRDKEYYDQTGKYFPFRDNPSNQYGTGFISTYDTEKERVIFTKKDFVYGANLPATGDYELCTQGGDLILFDNFQATVDFEASVSGFDGGGWNFVGIEDCRMKFERTTYETVSEEREFICTLANDTDVHFVFDNTGSFSPTDTANIEAAVDAFIVNLEAGLIIPDWTGTAYKNLVGGEAWLTQSIFNTMEANYAPGTDFSTKNILMVNFTNEAASGYHLGDGISNPTSNSAIGYDTDYTNFVNILYPSYNSFLGIVYPIILPSGTYELSSKAFLQHAMSAIKTGSYSALEAAAIAYQNGALSIGEQTTLETALQGVNPYPQPGLDQYGWVGKWDKQGGTNPIITPEEFEADMIELLSGTEEPCNELVDVIIDTREVNYIDGVITTPVKLDNSWTLSYALANTRRKAHWVSWHSYIPNFYINVPEKFYSWIQGDDNIWKHNNEGAYQNYYGILYPHILEYVSNSNPVATRLWNSIKLLTEARLFDTETQEYFEDRFTTFNKAILYNSRQCTGELTLIPKDTQANQEDYLMHQTVNLNDNSCLIDRNEGTWSFNDFRDIRTNYNAPIWDSSLVSVQDEYYIDKILNTSTMDVSKDWTQLESFRDKYLAIRLIFDNFVNTKLITNYSVENEQQSFR